MDTSYDGSGVSVVVIDTGIDTNHSHFGPDLNQDGISDRIIKALNFGSNTPENWLVGGGDHGTHVAGIIGGSSQEISGIAPNVDIISINVFELYPGGLGAPDKNIKAALDWCIKNADEYNIVAINMSLGGGEFDTSSSSGPYSAELAALNNLGVCVVSASGNSYDENEIQGVSYPSSDKNSLSVGAVHSDKLYDSSGSEVISKDEIVYWSQRDDDLTTVMAPGWGIVSSTNYNNTAAMSGTSMAAPMVSGAIALFKKRQ